MNFIKKNYHIIIVFILCIVLILINYDFTKLVIGLDNASPYFNISDVLGRIKGTSSVIYGGILFQAPFISSLKLMGLSPEIISNLYLSINFILGSLGVVLLSRKITGSNISSLFSSLVLITSLFTVWIFSNPNFLFIASYGSIPLLVYLLSKDRMNLREILSIIAISLIFLTTSLNIIAFFLYLIQIGILSYLLSKEKNNLKKISVWIFSVILTWYISIQLTMLINGDSRMFILQILNYISELIENPYMKDVTSGILSSEKTNSLIDVSRFSTGWMELHDSKNVPIFSYYDLYKGNSLLSLIGIIPFALSLLTIFFERSKRTLLLTILLISFLLISSIYGISIIERIPYVKDALRWPTSKLWPIYVLPLTLLSGLTVSKIVVIKKIFAYILIPLLSILLFTYSYPWISGHLISSKTQVSIPMEYFNIPRDSKILVLPKPQKLYMREYEWGYYGSDFLSYITNSEIVDGANLYEYSREYEEILKDGKIPEDIQYILYDTSAEIHIDENTLKRNRELTEGFTELNSNMYFKIYGKE